MPFLGNYVASHPMAPATQTGIIDGAATLAGNASVTPAGVFYGGSVVTLTADGDGVIIPAVLLTGNSVVSFVGKVVSGAARNVLVTIRGRAGGTPIIFDEFTWRTGEVSVYETLRISGEEVFFRLDATNDQTTTVELQAYLNVISV